MSAPAPTFGRYLLGPHLAVGGMGEVHLATQLGMGEFAKPLVLKLLLPHLAENPRAVEMFLTEARLASRMNHPNVVHIFDVGFIDGRHFIAMELVRGVAMSKLIKALFTAGRQLDAELIFFIARALCDGLHHAHEQRGADGRPLGLIHRDVTPENVLLGVEGQVKLTDFGVARAQAQGKDATVVGKLGYIAPEQAAREDIDRRADLFSAAITLFGLASGLRPFHRETKAETLAAVREQPLPDLRALRPDLPAAFVAALERAASKDPADRFATAKQMRDALPAPTRADTSELLGALVLELCGAQLSALDAGVEKTATLRARTAQLSPTPDAAAPPQAIETVTSLPVAKRRWPWVVAPLAFAGFAAGGFFVTREAPAPPVEMPVPAPGPVVAAPAVPVEPAPVVEAPPEPAPTPTPVAAPAPVPKKTPRHVKRPAATPPPAEKIDGDPGFVVVDATPWAMVTVNGKAIGETPIAEYPVAPGSVVVELKNPETGKSVVQNVKVARGKRAYVKGDLR